MVLNVRMLNEPARACKEDLKDSAPLLNCRRAKEGKREVGGLNFNIVADPIILSEPIDVEGVHVCRRVVSEDWSGDGQARRTIG